MPNRTIQPANMEQEQDALYERRPPCVSSR
jgi:hypothetical protein